LKQALHAAIRVRDRTVIEIDYSITKMAAIKDGQLFTQELTSEGNILFKRLQDIE